MSNFQLDDDDVVSIANPNQSFAGTELCTVSKLNASLRIHLSNVSPLTMQYVQDGKQCKVLKTTGGGWQKGTMRIRLELEFIPDEPPPDVKPDEVP
jgi:hypothetical protein